MSAKQSEKEAVRTTIVGGRPPGSGRDTGTIPRGIEVLVKKASVDPEFCERLLERRGDAAADIGLELDPAECAMLNAISRDQLAQIISRTSVPVEHRRVFLGRVAAAMLGILGAGLAGCSTPNDTAGNRPPGPETAVSRGIRPHQPASIATEGIRPDRPEPKDAASAGIRP